MVLKLKAGSLLLLGACVLSCGDEDDDDKDENTGGIKPVSGFFLTKDQITKPSTVKTSSEGEVLSELSSSVEVYNNQGEETDSDADPEVDKCIDDIFAGIKFSATDTKVSVGAEIDVGKCFTLGDAEEGVTIKNASVVTKFYMEVECASGGLAEYDGKTFESDDTVFYDCPESVGRVESSTISSFTGSFSAGGETIEFSNESKSYDYTGSDDLGTCTQTVADGQTTSADCVETSISEETDEEEKVTVSWIKVFPGSDVVYGANDDDVWPISGEAAIEFNNWAGTLAYQGKDTPPIATLNNGTDDVEGSLTTKTGLTLQMQSQEQSLRLRNIIRSKFGF